MVDTVGDRLADLRHTPGMRQVLPDLLHDGGMRAAPGGAPPRSRSCSRLRRVRPVRRGRCAALLKRPRASVQVASTITPTRFDSSSEVPGGGALMFSAPSLNGGRNSRPISGIRERRPRAAERRQPMKGRMAQSPVEDPRITALEPGHQPRVAFVRGQPSAEQVVAEGGRHR